MFIGETSAYIVQSREYGWAESSKRLYDTHPKSKKTRVSLVAAISLRGTLTEQALITSDTVNQNAFLYFLEFVLLPTLAEGSVLVMHNSSVHRLGQNGRYRACPHGEAVRELAERFGCELLYLPT